MTPSDKRFYTYTLRVTEEAVVASRDRDDDVLDPESGGAVTEQDLKDLGEMITDNIGDISGYVARGARIVEVTGPTRDRGGDILGVTGPARTIAQLSKRLEVSYAEIKELQSWLDGALEAALQHAPRCWDGDESAESIATSYVRALEKHTDQIHRGECAGECAS